MVLKRSRMPFVTFMQLLKQTSFKNMKQAETVFVMFCLLKK